MVIDLRTIFMMIGIAHLIQVGVFYFQYQSNRNINGPGWWLAWTLTETLGFVMVLLRDIPALQGLVVALQDGIILSGTVFIYIGVRKFFDRPLPLRLVLLLLSSFMIIHLFFLLVIDDINLRTLALDSYLAVTAFLTAAGLYRFKTDIISSTARVNTVLFLLHGGFFASKAFSIILGHPVHDMYEPTWFNYLQYFDALYIPILITFGFIMLLNQRLTGEISEAKAHFELIFNTSPDAVSITRMTDGFYVNVNEGYFTISGYSREELQGKSSLDINIWADQSERDGVVKQIREQGKCENYEIRFRHKDGSIMTGLFSAKQINIKGVPHIIAVTRDISERIAMMKALRESEAHYRLLTEGVSDVVWKQDRNNVFTYISPSDQRLRGYEPGEWIGHHVFEILSERGIATVKETLQQRMELREGRSRYEAITFEVEQRCKDGSFVWTEVVSTPEFDDSGTITGYHGISRNISGRKKAEQLITQKNSELQKMNGEKDKFFSIIAHDLKSPFTSIMGFSELLTEKAAERDFDGIREYARIILQSSRRVMDLLMNLMEWTRSQTGRMHFNPEAIDLVYLINENVLLFTNAAEQKGVTIVKELAGSLPVVADQGMINTILRNLLSNAIKFTRSGGTIVLSATERNQEVLVCVQDNGVGISKEGQQKLFQVSENYSTAGTNNEKGTGLGLILCKEFVERHGGRIWVESEPGAGSAFYFTLANREG